MTSDAVDPVDLNTVLGVAIGYCVAQIVRWIGKRRFWGHVVERAKQYLDDPAVPIDNPEQAAEAALVDAQRPRVRAVAKSIAPQNVSPSDGT